MLADGEMLAEGLTLGETDALGDCDGLILGLAEGLTLALGD